MAGIKIPNSLMMLLIPSEILEEANSKEIHIDHERMYVKMKNFADATVVDLFMLSNSLTFLTEFNKKPLVFASGRESFHKFFTQSQLSLLRATSWRALRHLR